MLGVGITGCVQLRRWGVPRTYIRDLLHIGAGFWVLGWPFWNQWLVRVGIAGCAALLVALAPGLARSLQAAASFQDSVSDRDEGWAGLIGYTVAFELFTAAGLHHRPFPAAAALWALCLGDGIGGGVGGGLRGRFFRLPGGEGEGRGGAPAGFAGGGPAAGVAGGPARAAARP